VDVVSNFRRQPYRSITLQIPRQKKQGEKREKRAKNERYQNDGKKSVTATDISHRNDDIGGATGA
jgi:hypothetical protein